MISLIFYKFKDIHITLKKTFAKANEWKNSLCFGENICTKQLFSVPNTFKQMKLVLLAHSNQRGEEKKDVKKLSLMEVYL